MKPSVITSRFSKILAAAAVLAAVSVHAQTNSAERDFPQSKTAIEAALKLLQGNLAGRLPVLEGFAKAAERPLDRCQRGYYQSAVDVRPTASGGSVVRVSTKVTAWYADPNGAKSGYQLLISNGRIETDLLDQLQDQLAKGSPGINSGATSASSSVKPPVESQAAPGSSIAAPAPTVDRIFSPAAHLSLPERTSHEAVDATASEKNTSSLQAEANNLEEVLKNTAHPRNLVAVKASGTPIVSAPSLTAQAEFLASKHDEFELLDFNADWVHVRISGLSRGWIWRNRVEMPEGISDTDTSATTAPAPAVGLYHIVREQTAPFPGDWPALRSKSVRILSVQKLAEGGKDAGPKQRLEYAKFLLKENYKKIAQQQDVQGVVLIFDSADGGMIAASTDTLRQWAAATLSDTALWHDCFFDPPEAFDTAGYSASK